MPHKCEVCTQLIIVPHFYSFNNNNHIYYNAYNWITPRKCAVKLLGTGQAHRLNADRRLESWGIFFLIEEIMPFNNLVQCIVYTKNCLSISIKIQNKQYQFALISDATVWKFESKNWFYSSLTECNTRYENIFFINLLPQFLLPFF